LERNAERFLKTKEKEACAEREPLFIFGKFQPPAFAWGFFISKAIEFEPGDGVLNQPRNSGTLRYFPKMELQNKIGELSVDIIKIRERQQQEI
jgi:hypothetical protein